MSVKKHAGAPALALVVLAAICAWPAALLQRDDQTRFCTAGLAFVHLESGDVALEDQGDPGRDGCDDATQPGGVDMPTLGFDCRVRDRAGTVLETVPRNRSDGTCGQTDR